MRPAALCLLGAALLGGCGGTSSTANPGLESWLRLNTSTAQFVPGKMPELAMADLGTYCGDFSHKKEAVCLPAVHTVNSGNNAVRQGQTGRSLNGTVDLVASGVAVGFKDDPSGYFVVPVGVLDANDPYWDFSTPMGFSPDIPTGEHDLVFRGVDADGHFGPPYTLQMNVFSAIPDGDLVISLGWDNQADLDLHVVLPSGVELSPKRPSGYKNPGGANPTAADYKNAGYLDFDSNGGCLIDGRRHESAIFPVTAPLGRYKVYVDTYSLCGQGPSHWEVLVQTSLASDPMTGKQSVGATWFDVLGTSTDFDTVVDRGQSTTTKAAPGALALEFCNQTCDPSP